ncbi:kinase-like domain-containing protein [Lobosporangium transversale]|uniref:Kinase-like domain-containing protein n=1 Tax=Lobosporangium transversale TaxID=64571 RepID=A0A1Y2H2T0_9FUNG|nr:kinase-like domain-containing protein [Lobosporangium transversale]ORZ27372.1 kinase-like domain-containing protein [Lobosporangium transversale]|eukprot:XP_021885099.1 kinase-like domain-containing protein [Lobosporangium transversale]
MDSFSQGHVYERGQHSRQQQQHTPHYRHVSVHPQNLSTLQESIHQESAMNTLPNVGSDSSDYGYASMPVHDPLHHNHSSNNSLQQQQHKHSGWSTGHVGIMIDDHQGHDQEHGHAQGHAQTQTLPSTHTHPFSFEQGHTPTGSPTAGLPTQHKHQQQQQQQPLEPLPPSAVTSHSSSRNSYTGGMFKQGYSQYQGQLPGATLSRHLSIQLSPNSMLLPPPPQALQPGGLKDYPSSSNSVASSQTGVPSRGFQSSLQQQQQQQAQASQQYHFQHQQPQHQHQHQQYATHRQSQSPSQQVALPPPPVKHIRSPMRSPNVPQLSSQAMAHAQAQSQIQMQAQQYRQYHAQGQQQFPPRTHRRSIQPLTLDQQQPKGGSFRYVRNQADLWPQKGSQKYRSIDAHGHSISPLRALTELLTKTYSHCNRDFKYEPSYNPRRVLTKPSKPVHNEGYDNEDYDYILYVGDILGSEERQRYLILDVLGQGTFGQVVKCQNLKTNAIVAVKVIKNKPAYFNQSMMEVTVLELLNGRYDVDDRHHILRLQDTFIHRRHLCLVFELLSVNLYELIKQNQFRGLSMSLVRVFTAQLLDVLCVLNEARIIHCDLKPENVLLKNLETPSIKVIDFGSACHEQQTVYTYIQSRFYRSPEVLVGLPYSSSIDIWSVGCIAAELFLGLPLFPGSSEYNQLCRIVEMLGMLPTYMLDIGKTAHEFFEVVRPDSSYGRPGSKKYRLKSIETYSREHNVVEQPSKRYFQATTLPDIINSYPMLKKGMTPKEIEKEMLNRQSFINFLQGLLNLNPIERWSPHQAKQLCTSYNTKKDNDS